MDSKLENGSGLISAQPSQHNITKNYPVNETKLCEQSLLLMGILAIIKFTRYRLNNRFKNVYITKREAECIICLAWGCTTKQIAKILKLSSRTVESFINKIKIKLNCYDKAQLIEAAIECGFLECIRPKV